MKTQKIWFHIIASINGNSINTNGNMKLLASEQEFWNGKFHPVAWYKSLDKGKSFYTSMGHDPSTWRDPNFVKLIENAICGLLKIKVRVLQKMNPGPHLSIHSV